MTGGGGAGLKRRFAVLGLIFALAGLVAAWSWWQRRDIETTDDAFIEADILRVSPLVGGTAISVHFIDNARVEKGALLIEIDPADYRHRVAEARARHAAAEARVRAAEAALDLVRKTATAGVSQASSGLDQARKLVTQARSQLDATRAEADRADAEIRRVEDLFKGGTASRQRLDQAIADAKTAGARREAGQAAVAAAEAQVALAQAKLAEAGAAPEHIALREAELATSLAQSEETRSILGSAELDLARTRIVAPMSGRIAKKAVVAGDTVQRGQVLAALVGT
ncbi:MAG: HlyD family secretion protein, partial [Alphaproteobacteria bacterium]|nr:HlyD family secretion protein [Alphaproteobacteria bacterium]